MAKKTDTSTPEPPAKPKEPAAPIRALDMVGRPVLGFLDYVGGLSRLVMQTFVWMWRSFVLRKVRFGRFAFYAQVVRLGVKSVAVVSLVSGCIGLILALQMAPPLDDFGQTARVATIIAIAVVRELGPLISAVVLTGFAGASIAAELGTMVVGEEVEALRAHALNPVRFLVLPRMLATVLSLLVVCAVGELVAIGAGWAIGTTVFDIPSDIYIDLTIEAIDLTDFATGMFKAGVFGMIIAAIACYNGLNVTGGAAGVGKATTRTVVHSVEAIIYADLVFTAIFYKLGWT